MWTSSSYTVVASCCTCPGESLASVTGLLPSLLRGLPAAWKWLSQSVRDSPRTATFAGGRLRRDGATAAADGGGADGQGNCLEPSGKPESRRPEQPLLRGEGWEKDARDRSKGLWGAVLACVRAERGDGRLGGLRASVAWFRPLEEGVLGVRGAREGCPGASVARGMLCVGRGSDKNGETVAQDPGCGLPYGD